MEFGNQILTRETITSQTPVLDLQVDDGQLVTIISQVIAESEGKAAEKRIKDRQDTNRRFWRGQQVDTSKLDGRYQTPHVDNVVYEKTENRITLASSRLPEITLAPPKDEPELIEHTKKAERSIRNRIDSNTIKRLIKDGLRHHEVDLIGVMKIRWDKNKGKNGDYVFELVDPQSVIFSARSRIVHDGFTAENCDIIIQWLEEPTQLVLSKFPQKAEELRTRWGSTFTPQKIRYAEIHFSWYDQQGGLIEGVCWKFDNLILGKTKTPYFDYQGFPVLDPRTGQIEVKKRNHFDRPRKPYILFSYQNMGDWVYDATTPLEQAIKLNSIINRRERQITEIADRTIPKMVFGSTAFKSGDAEKWVAKMNNPRDHVQLTGSADDVKKALMVVQGNAPDRILYEDVMALRGRIDGMFNTQGMSTAAVSSSASGISKQISRESDLTVSDDIIDFMVERVVYEMCSWALQMQKMYYTQPRPIRNLGRDGEVQFDETSTDDIEDDVDVLVKASSTDAQMRRANATQFMAAKITDPYTIFEDLDVTQPKERVRRLVSFLRGSQDMWRGYMEMLGIEDDMFDTDALARKNLEKLLRGETPTPPQTVDESYVQTFRNFLQSGEMDQIEPEVQQRIAQHVAQLKEVVNNQMQGQANAGQQQDGFEQQAGGVSAAFGAQGQPAPPAA